MVRCQLEICPKDLQVLMNCGNNEIHRQHSETVHVELMKGSFWCSERAFFGGANGCEIHGSTWKCLLTSSLVVW